MPAWKTTEVELLRQIYPNGTQEKILALLPRHSWSAIQGCAQNHSIRRERRTRVKFNELHPVITTLVKRRHELGITQDKVARDAGLNRFSISRHEMGRGGSPSIDTVGRWGAALSMNLTITEADQSVA